MSSSSPNGSEWRERLDRIERFLEESQARFDRRLEESQARFDRRLGPLLKNQGDFDRRPEIVEQAQDLHQQVERNLLRAQVLQQDAIEAVARRTSVLEDAMSRLAGKLETLAGKVEVLAGKVDALVDVVDGLVRRPPPPQ